MAENGVPSRYIQAADVPWEALYPGVEGRSLHRDPAQHTHVMLMRYHAGAVIRTHRHTAVEHIFVLEGSVEEAFAACTAGYYALRLPGCVHSPGSRPGGLVLAISYGPTERVS